MDEKYLLMLDEGFQEDPLFLAKELSDILFEFHIDYVLNPDRFTGDIGPWEETILFLWEDLTSLIGKPENRLLLLHLLGNEEIENTEFRTIAYYIGNEFKDLYTETVHHYEEVHKQAA